MREPASGGRLDDRQPADGSRLDGRGEGLADGVEAGHRLRLDRVPDPGATSFARDPAGLAQDPQVMRDRRLRDVIAAGDIAGTDRASQRELTEDGQPYRVGGSLQEQDLGIGLTLHAPECIDKCLLRQVSMHRHNPPTGDPR
jgi:hypothetical protein